jgi:hypothetical protein
MDRKIFLVGVGGIGSNLGEMITRFCRTLPNFQRVHLILIDGDKIENSNLSRQKFEIIDINKNKAQALADYLRATKPEILEIDSIPEFVTTKNIRDVFRSIQEQDIVITALDSTPPRKLIAEYLEQFPSFILLNPGNELTDGSLQVTIKRNGTYLSPNINNALHPEIFNAKKPKKRAGCAVLALSNAQVITTNVYVATLTAKVVSDLLKLDEEMTPIDSLVIPAEVYFDLTTFTMRMISPQEINAKLQLMSERK